MRVWVNTKKKFGRTFLLSDSIRLQCTYERTQNNVRTQDNIFTKLFL